MLQKMTKRVRRGRNWRIEIKPAAIDKSECGGCENSFRKSSTHNGRVAAAHTARPA
jgi:hypothetical protein